MDDARIISTLDLWNMLLNSNTGFKGSYSSLMNIVASVRRRADAWRLKNLYMKKDGVLYRYYELPHDLAICVITELSPASMIYLVRELIYLEDKHSVPSKVTDQIANEICDKSKNLTDELSAISRAVSVQSAMLADVDMTIKTLGTMMGVGETPGTVTIMEFYLMLQVSTWADVALPDVIGLLDEYGGIKRGLLVMHDNMLHINLIKSANVIDDIITRLTSGEPIKKKLEVKDANEMLEKIKGRLPCTYH